MVTLFILLVVFSIALLVLRFSGQERKYKFLLAARIAMSGMLLFTSISHFIFAEGMVMMIPDFIPYKMEFVYFTGILELAAAIGLLIPRLQLLTGCLLILFFVLILPANIKASMEHIDMQKANFDGNGLAYLWFRIPLQVLFILWTYICSVRAQMKNCNGRK